MWNSPISVISRIQQGRPIRLEYDEYPALSPVDIPNDLHTTDTDSGADVLMFDLASLSGPFHGMAVVGAVLAESLILYVTYGGVTRIAGDELEDVVRDG